MGEDGGEKGRFIIGLLWGEDNGVCVCVCVCDVNVVVDEDDDDGLLEKCS